MSAKELRTFALAGFGAAGEMLRISPGCTLYGRNSLAEERGLPQARGRLAVPTSHALRARAFGPGAPGSRSSAGKRRFVTAELRSFAASISAVRADRGWYGKAVV